MGVYFNMESKPRFVTSKIGVCLCAAICALLWGSAYPSIKLGYEAFQITGEKPFSVILYAGMRFTLAGFLSLAFHGVKTKKLLLPQKSDWSMVFILGFFQVVMQYFFMYIGTAHTTGVKTAIIGASHVFFAIGLSAFLFRTEKIRRMKLLGCVIGFAGVVLINITGSGLGGGVRFEGEGFLILSAIASAISTCLMGRYSKRTDTGMLATWQFIIGGGMTVLIGLAGGGSVHAVSSAAWWILIYLAFVSAAAYGLWSILLKHNPVSTVTVYTFMTPMLGTILSMLLLGESQSFGLTGVLALALVCSGIYLVNGKHAKA